MNEIVMIPVAQLEHHPENPRKDLGDLTELAESIRKNGVMQNLTVVPGRTEKIENGTLEKQFYLVVIGNRRMEAAKLAGMEALPCVISGMDHKTQISTMLEENMQRADLTPYEQAQGFQMMMDLGFKPAEIAEKTGFSEKTIKDRVKLTKLNQKNFEKAVNQGATLMDLIEVTKLESKAEQNEVLAKAGTNNFRQALKQKLGEQRYKKNEELLDKIAKEEGLTPIPENAVTWRDYQYQKTPTGTYESEEKIREVIRKTIKGNKGKPLFYDMGRNWDDDGATLRVYTEKEKTVANTDEEQAQKERRKEELRRLRATKKMWAEAYRLRLDFIRNYTVQNGFGMTTIGKLIIKYALKQQECWAPRPLPARHDWSDKYIREALEIKQEVYEDKKSIWELAEEKGIPQIRMTLAWILGGGIFDADNPEFGLYYWNDGTYQAHSSGSGMMWERYEFLQEIGYEMSDLEKQLMDGTHECYGEAKANG